MTGFSDSTKGYIMFCFEESSLNTKTKFSGLVPNSSLCWACVVDFLVTTSSHPQLWMNNVCTDTNKTTGSQFSWEFNEVWVTKQWRHLEKRDTYLSLEMLQSMTVFLLVLTIMKGRWMTELGGGGLFVCCSDCLFR